MTIAAIIASRDGTIHQAHADESVPAIARRLTEQRIGAMPVVDGDAVVGIVSERDVVRALATHGAGIDGLRVADIMTGPAITVGPGVAALSALSLMTRRRVRHLPVIDEGRMVAFVSIGDLVKHRIERIEAEAEAMRAYIQAS